MPGSLQKTVLSADGGTISYRQLGKGPGILILHGALHNWRSHVELAEALSDSFTLFLPDRRGRGLSSSASSDHGIQTELADLEALVHDTGARFVFGISSGALISLYACQKRSDLIDGAVLYEPPICFDRPQFKAGITRFRREIEQNDLASALITSLEITEMGPELLNYLPRWLARPLLGWLLSYQPNNAEPWPGGPAGENETYPPNLQRMLPTMVCDFTIADQMEGILDSRLSYQSLPKILILSGTSSRPFLIQSCELLNDAIPHSSHERLAGLTHLGAGNQDIEGNPGVVAGAIKRFFLAEGHQEQ